MHSCLFWWPFPSASTLRAMEQVYKLLTKWYWRFQDGHTFSSGAWLEQGLVPEADWCPSPQKPHRRWRRSGGRAQPLRLLFCIICNNQDMDRTWVHVNGWMGKKMWYRYSGRLCILRKGSPAICSMISFICGIEKGQTHRSREQNGVCQGLGVRKLDRCWSAMNNPWGSNAQRGDYS